MKLELIVVPYDVERTDTLGARSPIELLQRGLGTVLEAAKFEVVSQEIETEPQADKATAVAAALRSTARLVARASSRGRFPLVLSGGCLSAVGVAHGLQRMGRDFSVLWIDAHGDFNTAETTPSGYWDGMALAALCGRSLSEIYKTVELLPVPFRRIIHIGGRALDAAETEDFDRLKVLRIRPEDVDDSTAEQIRQRMGSIRTLYLHIDLDGLDPQDAPAVKFPVPNGILLGDVVGCLRRLPPPLAMTLAGLSFEHASEEDAERQIETCVRLVQAALTPYPTPTAGSF